MEILNEEELEIFHNWQNLDGVQFVTLISPKTGFPFTTPVNFILFNHKFYTSVHKNAAKVRFIRGGNNRMNLTFSINGPARKPYFGMTGTGLIIEDNPTKLTRILHDLNDAKLIEISTKTITNQLKQWVSNDKRITLEFTPISVYGKTRGAI